MADCFCKLIDLNVQDNMMKMCISDYIVHLIDIVLHNVLRDQV